MVPTITGIVNVGTVVEINHEREYQVSKGFTAEKDDELMPHQWVDLLEQRLTQVDFAEDPAEFRLQLVKVAAIAVAAIEAFDRAVH